MKKLLSLLSILTISGTAVPTTIAASPYQKEEIINSDSNYQQKNNLENLSRSKRERNEAWRTSDKILDVPKIIQTGTQYCGPAIAESILRYFGLNTDNLLNNVNIGRPHIYINFQHYLADLMRTHNVQNLEQNIGTFVHNWRNTMNNLIMENNLNYRREYSIYAINYNYGVVSIENNIRNSLQNNVPVALAYRGNLPRYFTEDSTINNHFIIIDGITGTRTNTMRETGSNLTFHYMDPWTGTRGTFDSMLLRLLVSNTNNQGQRLESYLVSYDQNSQPETQIPRPNQTEPMEMGNCGSVIRQAIIENNLHCILGTRSKRDYLNNNLSCPSAANPYYEYYEKNNENNDYFRVWGKSGHDGVELKISLKTALAFENFFQQNQNLEIKSYLENLIKHVEQKDERWSGEILDTDRELIKNFFYDGYLKFHDKLLQLIDAENKKKKNNSIFVRTWRTYNWADLSEEYQNSAFYISKTSKNNNY